MNIQLESYSSKSGTGARYFWLALFVVIAAVAADWWERQRLTNLRSLSLEEQETVIAVIDRTAIQHRFSKERVRRLKDHVANQRRPVFVDSGMGAHSLLVWEGEMLTISPRFFETDPISQEKSLLALAPPDGSRRSHSE